MKKAITFLLLLTLSLTAAASGLAVSEDADFYVQDEAGVLSQDTKDAVSELNALLEDEYDAQIVIVLKDYFGVADADELAVSLFNELEVSDRGMLLVASVREDAGSMTVGSEITNLFTTDDINSYLDKYFVDDFLDGKYDAAVTTLCDNLARWYDKEFGGNVSGGASGSAGKSESKSSGGFWAGLVAVLGLIGAFLLRNIMLIIIFAVIIIAIVSMDRRRYRGYYMSMGMPAPRYYPWYIFATRRPYHRYRPPTPPRPAPRRAPPPGSDPFFRPTRQSPPPRTNSSTRGHSGSVGGFGSPRPSASRPSAPRPMGRGMGGRSGGSVGGFGRRR